MQDSLTFTTFYWRTRAPISIEREFNGFLQNDKEETLATLRRISFLADLTLRTNLFYLRHLSPSH